MIIVRNLFVKLALTLVVLGGLLGRSAQAQQAGANEPKKY